MVLPMVFAVTLFPKARLPVFLREVSLGPYKYPPVAAIQFVALVEEQGSLLSIEV